ncbi:hypothetical protein THIX_110114 [Thiomonas sp. X19]|nr:hypothetical protein THIX_110114 [Thiomonas sp. X19]
MNPMECGMVDSPLVSGAIRGARTELQRAVLALQPG